MAEAGGVAGKELLSVIERVERLNEEIKALNDDKSDIFAEAKSRGFDVGTIKEVVKLRKLDPSEREEKSTLLDLYLNAIGMLPGGEVEEEAPRTRAHARKAEAAHA